MNSIDKLIRGIDSYKSSLSKMQRWHERHPDAPFDEGYNATDTLRSEVALAEINIRAAIKQIVTE